MKIIIFVVTYFYIYGAINPMSSEFTQIQILMFPFYFLYLLFNKKINILLKKKIRKILFWGLIIFFYHILIKILNAENSLFSGPFFQLPLKMLIKFTSSIFLYHLISRIKSKKKEKIEYLFINIILAIFLDLSIGVIRYIFPQINELLGLLNHIGKIEEIFIKDRSRLIGYGASFFPAGIVSSIALFLIIFLQRQKERILYWLLYFIIFFICLFTSRVVIIGMALSILYYLESKKYFIKRFMKLGISFILISIGINFLIFIDMKDNRIYQWAFELFLKKGESYSTNVLKQMWYIIPNRISTWIFGDGKWAIEDGTYYMHTDVGYLRLIWYSGITGVIFFLILILLFYKSIKNTGTNEIKKLNKYVLLLILIMNIKGYSEIYFIHYILLVFLIGDKKINRRD